MDLTKYNEARSTSGAVEEENYDPRGYARSLLFPEETRTYTRYR